MATSWRVEEFPQIAAQVSGFEVRLPPAARARATAPCLPPDAALRDPRRPCCGATRRLLRLIDEKGDVRTLADIEEQAIRFALDTIGAT